MKENKELINKLKEISNEAGNNPLKQHVIDYMLDEYSTDEGLITYVNDLLTHGCISGMVGDLIYYKDTVAFYDEYEEYIEDLLDEFKENYGYKSRPEAIMYLNGSAENITQEKNLLAWFAFEETVRQIYTCDLNQEW